MKKQFLGFSAASALLAGVVAYPALSYQAVPVAASVKAGDAVIVTDWKSAVISDVKATEFGSVEATKDGVKLITQQQPDHVYNLQTALLNKVALKKGDTILIQFAARSLQSDKTSGNTKLKIGFSKNAPDWDSSYGGEIGLSKEWQRFDIPFRCKNDFAVSEARLFLAWGFPAQELEVADVRVLRYGAEVAPESLPKTKRYADPVTPERLQEEVTRIVKLKRALAAIKDPSPSNGQTLLVQKNGTTSGDGSAAKPFGSVRQAVAAAKPGDTVLVGAGEYNEGAGIGFKTSGKPDAWITVKAAPGARPKIITSGWSGFEFRGGVAYIEVEGFEMEWKAAPLAPGEKPAYGCGFAAMYASHHIRILNNVVHGYGTGGIGSLDCDYMYIEGNVIYDTAKTSPYGGSAISLCRAFDSDNDPGYHNVIRRNICYDNELKVAVLETSGGNGKALTDGNGIIIDCLNLSRVHPLIPHTEDRNGPLTVYKGRTLIENNLLYNNGGRGVHVFRSQKVDVLNNTCYQNQKTTSITAGEFTAIEAQQVTFLNNIAYGRPEKHGNSQDGSKSVLWSHNLFFSADDILYHDGVMGKDPRFAAASLTAAADGFRLLANSPAKGQGIAAVAPNDDVLGKPRTTAAKADLGAFASVR